MKLQPARRAARRKLPRRGAMDMHLPIERLERREVVGFGLHPGQPVSALDAAGSTLAQVAPAVFDPRLRDGAEKEPAHRRQPQELQVVRVGNVRGLVSRDEDP